MEGEGFDSDEDGEAFVDVDALSQAVDPEQMAPPQGDDGEDTAGAADGDAGEPSSGVPEGMRELPDDSVQGFFDHTDSCFAVAVHPHDPALAVSGGADDRAFLWSVATGERTVELTAHADSVSDVAFNFDGTLVATAGLDGKVLVSAVPSGALVQALEGPGQGVSWLQWHPRGNALLAGSEDCTAWLWLAPQNKTVAVFLGHTGPVECGTMTADGKLCVTGSVDQSVRVWRPKDGTCAAVIQSHAFHQSPVVSVAVSPTPGGSLILSGDDSGGLFLSTLEGHIKGALIGHKESIEAICMSSTLPLAATGSMDGTLRVWDLNTLSQRQMVSFAAPEEGQDAPGVNQLRWHPSRELLLGCTTDGVIRLWDARSLQLLKEWRGPTSIVNSLAIAADWSCFVTGEDDNPVLVFALET